MKILELRKNGTNSNGITLVALVISIIVLLILATVTIQTLTGNNGLLTKAETAVQSNKDSQEEEKIKLAVVATQLSENGTISTQNLRNELKTNFDIDNVDLDEKSGGWLLKLNKEYTIYEDGKVEEGNLLSLLPKEYQQVEYIESTGTQYIDTGINIQSGLTIECDIAQTGGAFVNSVIYNPTNSIYYMGWNPNNGLLYYIYLGNTRQTTGVSLETNRIYHIKTVLKNGFQSMEVDGRILKTTNISGDIIISNKNLNLFGGYDENGVSPSPIRLGNSKYFDNNNHLIRNFIPCYSTTTVKNIDGNQVPTNTKGLYDIVGGKFYTNQNTSGNDFTAGPDV